MNPPGLTVLSSGIDPRATEKFESLLLSTARVGFDDGGNFEVFFDGDRLHIFTTELAKTFESADIGRSATDSIFKLLLRQRTRQVFRFVSLRPAFSQPLMSPMGHNRKSWPACAVSGLPPQASKVGSGSKGEELNVSKSSPLYPTIRTSTRRADTSQKGQEEGRSRRSMSSGSKP